MPIRILVWSLVTVGVLVGSCKKQKDSFNNTDCDKTASSVDTAYVGLVRYWVDVEKDPITDDQVKVFVRSDGEVDLEEMDALYIQLNNRYGCYQTKNREKFFAISDDYFLFREIPPTFVVGDTRTKVSIQLNDTTIVLIQGDTL